jgi:DNA-binding response OmpR family regulator
MSGYNERALLDRKITEAAYLAKPFSPKSLAIKVREVLDSTREPASTPRTLPFEEFPV